MTSILTKLSATTAAVLLGGTASAATLGTDATAFALGNEGASIVALTPLSGAVSSIDLTFENDASITLDGIAYRPRSGQTYGYDDETDTVFEIDVMTGAATAVVTNAGITNSNDVGFDFNNVLDAARIVDGQNENVVFFPTPTRTPSELVRFTDVFYVDGDANEGRNPNIIANAYTNAVPNPATTAQYVIDSEWDILATLGNNAGTLNTVGAFWLDGSAFDLTEDAGFDILSLSEDDNTAFALLTDGDTGTQGIYTFGLDADDMGRVNLNLVSDAPTNYGVLDGLAVVPTAAVPVPGAGLMLLTALGGAAALRRKRVS